jgi:hypothetical protein
VLGYTADLAVGRLLDESWRLARNSPMKPLHTGSRRQPANAFKLLRGALALDGPGRDRTCDLGIESPSKRTATSGNELK